MWIRETNESEPPMRHRKDISVIETNLHGQGWDKTWKVPVDCPGGGRCRGGVKLIKALAWNVGTERFDVKGEVRGAALRRIRLPMRSDGADWPVVVMKPGNSGGAKGPDRPVSGWGQPERGGVRE